MSLAARASFAVGLRHRAPFTHLPIRTLARSASGDSSSRKAESPLPPPAVADADGKETSIPLATTAFKMANPETMLNTQSRMSWSIFAGTVACCGAYYLYLLSQELREGDEVREKAEVPRDQQIQRVLADGRMLMADGSIIRPSKKP